MTRRPRDGRAGRSVRRTGGITPPAPFNPASLFGVNDRGVILDFTDASKLFQLSDGTIAVVNPGDPIGYAADLGPIGRPALQATAANRPFWTGVPKSLGGELVTNGRFAADTDWTKGTGWTIAAGVAAKAAGAASLLSQGITLSAGKTYFVHFNVTRTAGAVTAQLTGGTTVNGASRSATGSYIEILTANTNTTLSFSADAAFAGTVFNVSVKEITAFASKGAFLYGNPQQLVTANIDCSNSGKATLLVALKQDSASGTQNVVSFGAYGSVAGSILCDLATQPFLRLWGTGGAVVSVPVAERGAGFAARQYVNEYLVDMAGATIADQVELRARGVLPAQSTSGVLNGSAALANSTFRVGVNSLRGLVQKVFFINRELTDAERAQVRDEWMMAGMCFGAVLGDSTVGITSSPLPNAQKVSDFVPGLVTGAADVSESGNRIADQLAYWNAMGDRSKLRVVFVQIGLNDVKGRVGAGTATTAQVIAELQSLVNTIRADVPANCKIYICGLTPCKVWLDAAAQAAAAYQAWLDVNAAIAGTHTTNITGVDGRITSHVAALADASNNLLAIYDHNADGVHESNEARFIIGQAWRAQLEADALVQVQTEGEMPMQQFTGFDGDPVWVRPPRVALVLGGVSGTQLYFPGGEDPLFVAEPFAAVVAALGPALVTGLLVLNAEEGAIAINPDYALSVAASGAAGGARLAMSGARTFDVTEAVGDVVSALGP